MQEVVLDICPHPEPHTSFRHIARLGEHALNTLYRSRIVIMGAAGRDFHNFNAVYRDDPAFEFVAFTAALEHFLSEVSTK
jgi:hypothetical protein